MIRRGIVVVHGVGDQQRADQLDTVVEQIVGFLGRAVGHGNVHLITRSHREDSGTPSATIYLTPSGQTPEEWHVREAWWAQSFKPTDKPIIIGWAIRAFFTHLWATWCTLIVRNLKRLVGRPPKEGTGVWRIPKSGPFYQTLDAINWVVISLGYIAVYLIGALLLIPVQLLLLLPMQWVFPDAAEKVRRAIINLITGNIGDQQAMTNRYVAISAAADVVSTALYPFLDPDHLAKTRCVYDTVSIVAHSGGAVVSYEALAGKEVQDWLANAPDRRITWITAGSGLNLAWRMRAQNKDRDRVFWHRRIDDHVNWVNIYARYDPVAQGEPPAELVEALTGPAVGRSSGRLQPFVSLRVANDDWPFSDHGGYWTNREESMARIIHAISDSRLGSARLDPENGSYAEATAGAPHMLAHAVQKAVQAGPDHRRAVTRVQAMRLLAGVVAVGVLTLGRAWVMDLGARLMGSGDQPSWTWLPDGVKEWIAKAVPESVLGVALSGGFQEWLAGAVALAIGVAIVLLLAGPIIQYFKWRQVEVDDTAPSTPAPAQPVV